MKRCWILWLATPAPGTCRRGWVLEYTRSGAGQPRLGCALRQLRVPWGHVPTCKHALHKCKHLSLRHVNAVQEGQAAKQPSPRPEKSSEVAVATVRPCRASCPPACLMPPVRAAALPTRAPPSTSDLLRGRLHLLSPLPCRPPVLTLSYGPPSWQAWKSRYARFRCRLDAESPGVLGACRPGAAKPESCIALLQRRDFHLCSSLGNAGQGAAPAAPVAPPV